MASPPAVSLHILHVFPSFQLGGSQRRFAALANHFGDRYAHTVISLDGCTEAATLLEAGIVFRAYPVSPRRGVFPTLIGAHHTMKMLSPDLLVTYNWGAMEWAAANLLSGVRHLHIEDGFGPEEALRQLRRRSLFRCLILNLHSTLLLPSQTLVAIAENIWRISSSRTHFVPNGISCSRFQLKSDPSTDAGFRGQGPVIGTVATLRKEKAIDRLIYAFRDLRRRQPARLVIVGDGPERPVLEALVVSCDLTESVTFTGSLSHPESAVTNFDIFAISSDTEQMPLSVLEAMAAGLPIVATDVGDIRSMVAVQNQPFVVAKSAESMTVATQRLLDAPALRLEIGNANRARAFVEYDESRMFARYGQIFSGQP